MFYSQSDPRWAKLKLGTSSTTFSKSSCKITSLANLINKTPIEVNRIMLDKRAYVNGCLSEDKSTAKALGIKYNGVVYYSPKTLCIAETNDYRKYGVPQHFFLFENGLIVDPLDKEPDWKENNYNIVSYRLFNSNKMFIIPDWAKASCLKAKRKGVITKSFNDQITAYRLATILDNAGILDNIPDKK